VFTSFSEGRVDGVVWARQEAVECAKPWPKCHARLSEHVYERARVSE
jgi:hypothetical protein